MNKLHQSLLISGLALLAVGAVGAVRTGTQQGWSRDTVKLTKEGRLGDLFDSGLRPYRFPRMETSSLEFKHSITVVSQSDGVNLPEFFTELADISVHDGGLLGSITLKQAPMNLVDARKEMLRWIQFGKEPTRTVPELDHFLKAVESDFRGYNYGPGGITHDFRLAWPDSNGLHYVVWFQQARLPDTPLAIHMAVSWNRTPLQAGSSYDIPIPPPSGYEHVDMSAPKDFGPDSPPEDPEIERVRKAGVMPDYSMLTNQKPGIAKTVPIKLESEAPKAPLWWIIPSVAGLITLLVVLIRKHRRQKQP